MPNFDSPRLFKTRPEELSLSNQALLDLMHAVLSKGVPFRFMARGWSMSPFIRNGDVITIASIINRNPGLGEVVAFIGPDTGKLVVHRIVAKHDGKVLLVGDSVPDYPDGFLPIEDLLGRVIRIKRNQKRIWLGLGPERVLIAWLSRTRLLTPLRNWVASWRTRIKKRKQKS